MTTLIRKIILPMFSVFMLTWIVGPGFARADLLLTLDPTTPSMVHPGAIVEIVYDIQNTSNTETLSFSGDSFDALALPSGTTIGFAEGTSPAQTLTPQQTTKAEFTLTVPFSDDTRLTINYEIEYAHNPDTGMDLLNSNMTDIPIVSVAAVPEPNTLFLAGLVLQRRLSGPTSHAPPLCATSLAVACGRATIALPTPMGPSQDFVGVPDAYLQQVD